MARLIVSTIVGAAILAAQPAWSQAFGDQIVVPPPPPSADMPFPIYVPVEVCFLGSSNPFVIQSSVQITGSSIILTINQLGPGSCLGGLTGFDPHTLVVGPLAEGTYNITYDWTLAGAFQQRFATVQVGPSRQVPTLSPAALAILALLIVGLPAFRRTGWWT